MKKLKRTPFYTKIFLLSDQSLIFLFKSVSVCLDHILANFVILDSKKDSPCTPVFLIMQFNFEYSTNQYPELIFHPNYLHTGKWAIYCSDSLRTIDMFTNPVARLHI